MTEPRRLFLTLALMVAAFLGGAVARPGPDVTAQPATPAGALVDLLIRNPIADANLPEGFTVTRVTQSPASALDAGAAGGVQVTLEIADLVDLQPEQHRIEFVIYTEASAAERAYQQAHVRTIRRGGQTSEIAGLDRQAAVLETAGSVAGSAAAAAVCLVQSGMVLIAGVSVLPPEARAQTALNAIDLAQAGVFHLDRIVANPDSATPVTTTHQPPALTVARRPQTRIEGRREHG